MLLDNKDWLAKTIFKLEEANQTGRRVNIDYENDNLIDQLWKLYRELVDLRYKCKKEGCPEWIVKREDDEVNI